MIAIAHAAEVVQTNAISLQQSLGLTGVKGWVAGLVALVLVPYLFLKAKQYAKDAPHILFEYLKSGWQKNVVKYNIDTDTQLFIKHIGIEIVRFAEKKYPQSGKGPDRMNYLVNLGRSIPVIGILFRLYEKDVREVIEAFVVAMDEEMQRIANSTLPPIP